MSRIKNPLLSLDARNTLAKAITFVKRRGTHIAEKKPEIIDVQSAPQLSWRHMFLKCTALWNALSAAEQADWESLARSRHMTGYAYWQSQCLRPNPGIYLPLQGGTMQGDIEMAGFHVHGLSAPTHGNDATRRSFVNGRITADIATHAALPTVHQNAPALIAAHAALPNVHHAPTVLYTEGARVYHTAIYAVPHATWDAIPFNTEIFDTDAIHDNVVNNSRLTCKTAGKYIVVGQIWWAAHAVGYRLHTLRVNLAWYAVQHKVGLPSDNAQGVTLSTIINMSVNDFVQLTVYQTSGAPLNSLISNPGYPALMMQRIG